MFISVWFAFQRVAFTLFALLCCCCLFFTAISFANSFVNSIMSALKAGANFVFVLWFVVVVAIAVFRFILFTLPHFGIGEEASKQLAAAAAIR